MLSMLRYMADINDPRLTLLIWSNKTESSIVLPEDFNRLQKHLPNLKLIHALTQSADYNGRQVVTGRLDQDKIERLLEGYGRQSEVFVCGPPAMMASVSRMLRKAGFRRAKIHTEKFQF